MKRTIYDYSRTATGIVGLFQLAVALATDTNGILRWVLGGVGIWLVYQGLRTWRTPFITVTDSRLGVCGPEGIETFDRASILWIENRMLKGTIVIHFRSSASKSFPIPVLSGSRAIEKLLLELT